MFYKVKLCERSDWDWIFLVFVLLIIVSLWNIWKKLKRIRYLILLIVVRWLGYEICWRNLLRIDFLELKEFWGVKFFGFYGL